MATVLRTSLIWPKHLLEIKWQKPHGIFEYQVGYQADRIESVKLIIRSWYDLQRKQDGKYHQILLKWRKRSHIEWCVDPQPARLIFQMILEKFHAVYFQH